MFPYAWAIDQLLESVRNSHVSEWEGEDNGCHNFLLFLPGLASGKESMIGVWWQWSLRNKMQHEFLHQRPFTVASLPMSPLWPCAGGSLFGSYLYNTVPCGRAKRPLGEVHEGSWVMMGWGRSPLYAGCTACPLLSRSLTKRILGHCSQCGK